MKKLIAVCGANPAWQSTLFFDTFTADAVNRATKKIPSFASGKGINFCRGSRRHAAADTMLVQFCGGENGRALEAGLTADCFDFQSVRTACPTRRCTTCIGLKPRTMTELIEPSGPVDKAEGEKFLRKFLKVLAHSDAAAVCGTLPAGGDPEIYAEIARAAAADTKLLVADTVVALPAILSAGDQSYVKINAGELASITGTCTIPDGLRELFGRFPKLCGAAITDGAGAAWAGDGRTLVCYTLPELDGVINPLGCGDVASAVLTAEILNGAKLFDAFKTSLAAASANALDPMPGEFDRDAAVRIAGMITAKVQ